jgi:hypothetical protein
MKITSDYVQRKMKAVYMSCTNKSQFETAKKYVKLLKTRLYEINHNDYNKNWYLIEELERSLVK